MMIMTNEIIVSGQSTRGGWSRKQFEVLGISYPPIKGWKWGIIDKDYPEETVKLFLQLKDQHLKKNKNVDNSENQIKLF